MSMRTSWRSRAPGVCLGRVESGAAIPSARPRTRRRYGVSSPDGTSAEAAQSMPYGSYMQRYAEAKAELLRRAAAAGAERAASNGSVSMFVGHEASAHAGLLADYYRDIDFPDLAERAPGDLAGAALAHLELATNRPQGTAV